MIQDSTTRPRLSGDVYRYLFGSSISVFGASATAMAIPVLAVTMADATPSQLGLISAAAQLPVMILGLPIAAATDRASRKRRLLIGCEIAGLCTVITAAALAWNIGVSIALLIGVNLLLATVETAVETLYFAHLRMIVNKEAVTLARARLQAGEQVGKVGGQASSGALAAFSAPAVFVVDALSYFVSIVSLVRLRTPDRPVNAQSSERFRLSDLVEGFKTIVRIRFMRWLSVLLMLQTFTVGAVAAIFPVFAMQTLGIATGWYTTLFAFASVTAIVGSVITDRFLFNRDPRRLAIWSLAGMVLAAATLPFAGGPAWLAMSIAAIAIGIPGFFASINNIGVSSYITTTVPENLLGRTLVSLKQLVSGATVLGALSGGLVAEIVGVRDSLWITSGVSVSSLLLLFPLVRLSHRH